MRMDARRTMILCLAAKTFCIMQTHHSFNLNLDCSRSIFYLHYADQYQAKIHFPRERKNSIPFQLKLSANSQNTIISSVDWTSRCFEPFFHRIENTNIIKLNLTFFQLFISFHSNLFFSHIIATAISDASHAKHWINN